ncbi:hypothetical protein BJ944DRAFT_264822 [Cunninghamella echinulata]|nr:hypothetical protein BJ944DRAFT_264822 [Cunninghamella echinulata]
MTAKLIWKKSRLPNEVLAHIWDQQQSSVIKSGLLDRKGFVDGMQQIDLYLSKHQS